MVMMVFILSKKYLFNHRDVFVYTQDEKKLKQNSNHTLNIKKNIPSKNDVGSKMHSEISLTINEFSCQNDVYC